MNTFLLTAESLKLLLVLHGEDSTLRGIEKWLLTYKAALKHLEDNNLVLLSPEGRVKLSTGGVALVNGVLGEPRQRPKKECGHFIYVNLTPDENGYNKGFRWHCLDCDKTFKKEPT